MERFEDLGTIFFDRKMTPSGLIRKNSCSLSKNRKKREKGEKPQKGGPEGYTPFENPQRWMGQNTFPILLLNDDNMIGHTTYS